MFTDIGHKHSRTLVRTDVSVKGGNLVLACGYCGTDYGYFICAETINEDGIHFYSHPRLFLKKNDDKTYPQALVELGVIKKIAELENDS